MKNLINIASSLSGISQEDLNLLNIERDTFVVGKNDKRTGIVTPNNELIDFSPRLEVKTISGLDHGYISFPSASDLMIQWGSVNVQANSGENLFSFLKPFKIRCFTMVGSHVKNDEIQSLMVDFVSNTEYKVTIQGGIGSETVSWIAIGI